MTSKTVWRRVIGYACKTFYCDHLLYVEVKIHEFLSETQDIYTVELVFTHAENAEVIIVKLDARMMAILEEMRQGIENCRQQSTFIDGHPFRMMCTDKNIDAPITLWYKPFSYRISNKTLLVSDGLHKIATAIHMVRSLNKNLATPQN